MERDPRRAARRPQCPRDWEDQKATIVELRMRMELEDLMRVMEKEHLFKATENQYKKQFRKWKLPHKYIKDREYRAIISKKRKRERSGKTSSAFRWRGAEVKDSAIVRFQKGKTNLDADELFGVATPSEMSCYTPASTARSRSASPAENSTALSPTQEFNQLIDLTSLSSVHSLAKQSPRLSKFEWYPSFEDFVDRSAAGTPTIHSDTINGLFQYFETPIDTYEQQRQLSSIVTDLKCASSRHRRQTSRPEFAGLIRASELVQQDQKQARGLLALVFSTFQEAFGNMTRRLSVTVLMVACTIYSATGRADTAMTVLECLIPLIEQDPELVIEEYHTKSRLLPEFSNVVAEYDETTLRTVLKSFKEPLDLAIIPCTCFYWLEVFGSCSVLKKALVRYSCLDESSMRESLIALGYMGQLCHARNTRVRYQPIEQPEAYDPCLTEAARWEEVER